MRSKKDLTEPTLLEMSGKDAEFHGAQRTCRRFSFIPIHSSARKIVCGYRQGVEISPTAFLCPVNALFELRTRLSCLESTLVRMAGKNSRNYL